MVDGPFMSSFLPVSWANPIKTKMYRKYLVNILQVLNKKIASKFTARLDIDLADNTLVK